MVTSSPRVNPGMNLETGSSKDTLPSSASIRMAAAVNCLLMEPHLIPHLRTGSHRWRDARIAISLNVSDLSAFDNRDGSAGHAGLRQNFFGNPVDRGAPFRSQQLRRLGNGGWRQEHQDYDEKHPQRTMQEVHKIASSTGVEFTHSTLRR